MEKETPTPDSTTEHLLKDNMAEQSPADSSKENEILDCTPIITPKLVDPELPIPAVSSVAGFMLSDNSSMVSAQEICQRREALRVFSSELSIASSIGRSTTTIPHPTALAVASNNNMGISYDITPFSSTLSGLSPVCRICQCPAEHNNVLITPCRCDGSLKHIHATCLLKWIDVCNRRHRRVGKRAYCELCGYIYRKHRHVKYRDWRWPKIALRDRILHLIFAISLLVMIGCAVATVLCFVPDNGQYKRYDSSSTELTREEVITICCGITFFVSFFVSMSAEIKAKKTIHQIMRKCLRHNTVWFIENYNMAYDSDYRQALTESRVGEAEAKQ